MNTAKQLPVHVDQLPLLTRICLLWSEMLGQPDINPDQHIFLAGGDSLLLARLLMRLQAECGVALSLDQPWLFSTPRKMAHCCGEASAVAGCQQQVTDYSVNDRDFPASCSQQGLWFSELQADNCGLYNSGVVQQLRGPLLIEAMERAFKALQLQFPLLQSCLQPDASGRHLRVVVPSARISQLHVEALPPQELHVSASRLLAEPFEMGLGLWRCRLYRHDAKSHSLLMCCHHCLIDGWSGAVLLQQLALAYNALLSDPQWSPSLRDTAFASHCWRQQQFLCSEIHAGHLLWWQSRLAMLAPPPTTLPWQANAQHWPYRLQSLQRQLPPAQLQLLQTSCASNEVTLFAALMTALASALTAVSGHHEHVIAFPVAGRTRPEEENSIGCYMNLLPLPVTVEPGESPQLLLRRVHDELVLVQTRAIPWQSLVQALRPPPLDDGNAWTEVVLALQNFPVPSGSFIGLTGQYQPLASPYGQHLLKFEVTATAAGLCVQVDYAEAVLSAAVAEQLAMHLISTLQALLV
jgi:hypothetical protein